MTRDNVTRYCINKVDPDSGLVEIYNPANSAEPPHYVRPEIRFVIASEYDVLLAKHSALEKELGELRRMHLQVCSIAEERIRLIDTLLGNIRKATGELQE